MKLDSHGTTLLLVEVGALIELTILAKPNLQCIDFTTALSRLNQRQLTAIMHLDSFISGRTYYVYDVF